MDFLLDPYIIALPDTMEDDVLSDYGEALLQWSDMVKTKRHTFWLSSFVVSALSDCHQYPHYSNLKRFDGREEIFQAYDVFRSIEKEFAHPDYLEDHLENGHCEYDPDKSIILPKEIENRLHSDVFKALKETLALMAVAGNLHASDLAKNMLIASYPLPAPTSQIEVNLDILQSEDIEQIIGYWRLVSHPSQLDDIEGLANYWKDTKRCISWAYRQLCSCGALDEIKQKCPELIVGGDFNKSIQDAHLDRSLMFLDSLFRNTVLALLSCGGYEKKGKKHHGLRVDDEPTNPPIVRQRDGAIAWRVWITTGRPAYRLHYWRLENGQIELSKIGVHEDYAIV